MVTLMEQVIAAAPDFAHAHGILALALDVGRTPPETVSAVRARARREAETAIALYPPAGAAFDALYFLARFEAPTDLHLAEAQLREGLRQAPRYPFLPMRLCEFLMDVGRIAEGLVHCERAVALRPLAAPPAYRRALANWFAGQSDLAFRLMDEAWEQNPTHGWVSAHRFAMMAFGGRGRDAALILADAEQRPTSLTPEDVSVFERFLEVQAAGVPADADVGLKEAGASQGSGLLSSQDLQILMAGYLGRVDSALDLLGRLDPETLVGRMLLFHPVLDPVRRDPRFMRIVSRSGHVAYWRETGIWPDFCGDPTLPYDCKVEAAKVATAG